MRCLAQLYNQVGEPEAPQGIVTLKVALRKPKPREGRKADRDLEQREAEKEVEEVASSSSGETVRESERAKHMAQRGPPQSRTKKRKAKPTRRARLTRQSILELSQIPSASGKGAGQSELVDVAVQTCSHKEGRAASEPSQSRRARVEWRRNERPWQP